jgi:hypothetical protein
VLAALQSLPEPESQALWEALFLDTINGSFNVVFHAHKTIGILLGVEKTETCSWISVPRLTDAPYVHQVPMTGSHLEYAEFVRNNGGPVGVTVEADIGREVRKLRLGLLVGRKAVPVLRFAGSGMNERTPLIRGHIRQ